MEVQRVDKMIELNEGKQWTLDEMEDEFENKVKHDKVDDTPEGSTEKRLQDLHDKVVNMEQKIESMESKINGVHDKLDMIQKLINKK